MSGSTSREAWPDPGILRQSGSLLMRSVQTLVLLPYTHTWSPRRHLSSPTTSLRSYALFMMSHAARDAVTAMATSTPEALSAWDPASSIPTLTGSLLSLIATAIVILLWISAGGKKRRDFRYALILNLTVAGMIFPAACPEM
jgi:hypothetical protein